MKRRIGAIFIVILGALAGLFIDAWLKFNPPGLITVIVTVAVAAFVILSWTASDKEELKAEISLLKDKLDKLEQKDKE